MTLLQRPDRLPIEHRESSTTLGGPPLKPQWSADVAILGLGYVGLPTLLGFDAAGQRVVGVDIDAARIEAITSSRADLVASDRSRLHDALRGGRLVLGTDPRALSQAACVIVCVPTPVDDCMVPDLRILRAACRTVVDQAQPGQVIILTSTTYVGSTDDLLVRPLADRGLIAGTDLFVAFSPERIDPGNDALKHADVPRVVGGTTPQCTDNAAHVLDGLTHGVHRVSSSGAAELTKLLENTFRAVNIALVNEFADVAAELSLDVMEVVRAATTKPYGFMAFTPGPGVGGHCIPCDPHYLLWQLRGRRLTMPVVEQAMAGISARPQQVVRRVREVLSQAGRALTDSRIQLVGVTYKPDVDDLRESPAIEIATLLLSAGAHVSYHDSHVERLQLADGRVVKGSPKPYASDVDLVLVHTLHADLDLESLASAPVVLDATYRVAPRPGLVRL